RQRQRSEPSEQSRYKSPLRRARRNQFSHRRRAVHRHVRIHCRNLAADLGRQRSLRSFPSHYHRRVVQWILRHAQIRRCIPFRIQPVLSHIPHNSHDRCPRFLFVSAAQLDSSSQRFFSREHLPRCRLADHCHRRNLRIRFIRFVKPAPP